MERKEQIEQVLQHWSFHKVEVLEQLHESSPRLIFKVKADGNAVFIDLDDAGIGSRYLDAGSALTLRYAEHDENMNLWYRFDFAKAFLQGYYGAEKITRSEYDLLWHGAVYMFISYMQCYGPEAVDSLWKILKFALEQKEKLLISL